MEKKEENYKQYKKYTDINIIHYFKIFIVQL